MIIMERRRHEPVRVWYAPWRQRCRCKLPRWPCLEDCDDTAPLGSLAHRGVREDPLSNIQAPPAVERAWRANHRAHWSQVDERGSARP